MTPKRTPLAIPKTTKTNYSGIRYYNDTVKGKVYIATFTINKKKYRKIIGYEKDEFKTNAKLAYLKKEEIKNSIQNNDYIEKDLTFNQVWDIYLKHLKSSKSVSTRTLMIKESNYNCHFKNRFGSIKMTKINSIIIQSFVNEQLAIKAPKTVDNYLADLSAIFKFSIKHKITTINPIAAIDKPKYDNTLEYPLNMEESKRLFNTIINFKEPLYRGIFTFLLHGRRRNEVLSLTWDMINLENRTYEIGLAEIGMREEVGLLAYSPLAFGVLSGKYLEGGNATENDRVNKFPQFSRYNSEQSAFLTQKYADLAKELGISLTHLALAFVNHQPWVTANIIGATNIEQLKENISSIDVELSEEVLTKIDEIQKLQPNPAP